METLGNAAESLENRWRTAGESPGSRKTQFQPGHPRLGGRRKADPKPDPIQLLEQVCRGVRGSDQPPDLDALKLKLEELKQTLDQKPGPAAASRQDADRPKENEPTNGLPEKRKWPEHVRCPGCRSWITIDPSVLEPGTVHTHFCGARMRIGRDGQRSWS